MLQCRTTLACESMAVGAQHKQPISTSVAGEKQALNHGSAVRTSDRPSQQMRRLDILSASQASRLLSIFAIEEYGLLPPIQGGNIHCSSHNHTHLHGSPSLRVKGGDDKESVKSICCFGRCKAFAQRLSDYLMLIGPKGSAAAFWTKERVDHVLEAFSRGETPVLGWLDWKREKNLAAGGASSKGILIASARGTMLHSNALFSSVYNDRFRRSDPVRRAGEAKLIETVCRVRAWRPEIVCRLIDEGLIAVSEIKDDLENAVLHFAYRGFYANPPNLPARIVKDKVVRKRAGDATIRSFYYDPAYPSRAIADSRAGRR